MKDILHCDFRSDTVTQPTAEMKEAMINAPLGDDVFGEDPSVNALEEKLALRFGMEAGLFCPSGTMTNQIAIKIHTQPGEEIICDELSHIYQYEGGGIGFNSGCATKLLHGNRGMITSSMVKMALNNPEDVHKPVSRLVSVENTVNRGGGACYEFEELKKLSACCRQEKLGLHLDGARLFNAIVAKQENAESYGKIFDSISICLSKGLGTPVGSVLLGSREFIRHGRRYRKVLGGGMRQAGMLAAAGLYALDHHIERLAEDHTHAKTLAELWAGHPMVEKVWPAETNIVLVQFTSPGTAGDMAKKLASKQIKCIAISPCLLRMVTHLHITQSHIDYTAGIIRNL